MGNHNNHTDADSSPVPSVVSAVNPLDHVRKLIQKQASVLATDLRALEDLIESRSQELDVLSKARDTLFEALRGTEEIRVKMAQEYEKEDETEFSPREPVKLHVDHHVRRYPYPSV